MPPETSDKYYYQQCINWYELLWGERQGHQQEGKYDILEKMTGA
jgi:hypothetical protein